MNVGIVFKILSSLPALVEHNKQQGVAWSKGAWRVGRGCQPPSTHEETEALAVSHAAGKCPTVRPALSPDLGLPELEPAIGSHSAVVAQAGAPPSWAVRAQVLHPADQTPGRSGISQVS